MKLASLAFNKSHQMCFNLTLADLGGRGASSPDDPAAFQRLDPRSSHEGEEVVYTSIDLNIRRVIGGMVTRVLTGAISIESGKHTHLRVPPVITARSLHIMFLLFTSFYRRILCCAVLSITYSTCWIMHFPCFVLLRGRGRDFSLGVFRTQDGLGICISRLEQDVRGIRVSG